MTDMSCTDVEQRATEYALGLLPAGQAHYVDSHLRQCPACRTEIDDIRLLGDQLLDLVPDAEPPLGFDRKVLNRVCPHRPRVRWRIAVAGAMAAAVAATVGLVGSTVIGSHHHMQPAELTAVLLEGNRPVGSIYIDGHPPWVSMTVRLPGDTSPVTCQLETKTRALIALGTFQVRDGSGSWSAAEPSGIDQPIGARLVGPLGNLIATATFKANGAS